MEGSAKGGHMVVIAAQYLERQRQKHLLFERSMRPIVVDHGPYCSDVKLSPSPPGGSLEGWLQA